MAQRVLVPLSDDQLRVLLQRAALDVTPGVHGDVARVPHPGDSKKLIGLPDPLLLPFL